MRAEQRGAGLKERVRETWPDTEQTKTMITGLTHFTQRSHTGEDSNWEPDGVTHHVRFCEGPGVTVEWLRSCGTAGKPGGNRETNINLYYSENPVYSPKNLFLT